MTTPLLMGILNITPDSFSDGGKYFSSKAALAHAEQMIRAGADIIDIGGESTRPGARPVPQEEELKRVVPVAAHLAKHFPKIPVSIDTTKPEVARQCLDKGAAIINDISALTDPQMTACAVKQNASVILMHMQGTPGTMQKNPVYKNVVKDIKTFLTNRIRQAVQQGLQKDKIMIDPGIGFGKTVQHNLDILKSIPSFVKMKYPVVIGASQKSFIGKILGTETSPASAKERLEGTLAVHLWAAQQGAHILRVHDIKATKSALKMWQSFLTK